MEREPRGSVDMTPTSPGEPSRLFSGAGTPDPETEEDITVENELLADAPAFPRADGELTQARRRTERVWNWVTPETRGELRLLATHFGTEADALEAALKLATLVFGDPRMRGVTDPDVALRLFVMDKELVSPEQIEQAITRVLAPWLSRLRDPKEEKVP